MALYWHRKWDGFDKNKSPHKWFSVHTIHKETLWGLFLKECGYYFSLCSFCLFHYWTETELVAGGDGAFPRAQGVHAVGVPRGFSLKLPARSLGKVWVVGIAFPVPRSTWNKSAHTSRFGPVFRLSPRCPQSVFIGTKMRGTYFTAYR